MYRVVFVFLVVAVAVNVALLLVSLSQGRWLSAVRVGVVCFFWLWLAALYRALLRRDPNAPRFWLWYRREPR
jgi:hypothetical protein